VPLSPQESSALRIVFLTSAWAGIDDRIRRGLEPGGVPSVGKAWLMFAQQGWKVDVFVAGPNVGGHLHWRGVDFHWIRDPTQAIRWRPLRYLIAVLRIGWLYRQIRMFGAVWRMRTTRPQVIYCMRSCFVVVGWILARLSGSALVQRQYGTWAYYHLFERRTLSGRLISWGSYAALKVPCDLVIITNDGTRGDRVAAAARVPAQRLRFWINGVDKNQVGFRAYDRRESRVPTIVYAGRLARWKRVDRLIRAFSDVCSRHAGPLKLVVVGDGAERKQLEVLAEELGVGPQTSFIGEHPNSVVRDHMAHATIVALPHDLTNLTNTLLEALSLGCCVVAMDRGGTSDVIRHGSNGILVDSTDSMVEWIVQLLNDPPLREAISENAGSYAAAYLATWEERMEREYQEISRLAAAEGSIARANHAAGLPGSVA
jgi:glycosyltransferase involved in cell wall biosynthesis